MALGVALVGGVQEGLDRRGAQVVDPVVDGANGETQHTPGALGALPGVQVGHVHHRFGIQIAIRVKPGGHLDQRRPSWVPAFQPDLSRTFNLED